MSTPAGGPPTGLDARRAAAAGPVTAAARRLLDAHGLAGVRLRELGRKANLVLALDGLPAGAPPLVVRSPTRTDLLAGQQPADPWRHRQEVALGRRLAAAGAPVVPPAADDDPLPAGPHVVAGHVLTVWRAGRDATAAEATPQALGRALRAVHDAAAGVADALAADLGRTPALPPLGPVDADLRLLLRTAAASGEIVPELRDRLAAAVGTVTAALHARAEPARPVHGDAHPGNVLVLDGRLVWNDLEDACHAPVGWDLGTLASSQLTDGAAAVTAYGADPASLAPWVRARDLQRAAWTALRARTPAEVAAVHALLDTVLAG